MAEISLTCSEFTLALSRVNRWGATKVADYVARHGYDLEECMNFLELELEPRDLIMFNSNVEAARKDIQDNEAKHIHFISLFDERFPKRLCEGKDPVVFLYYVGDIELLSSKSIAIIGTREPEESFALKGRKAALFYAEKGLTVVSGLALGCDTIAHRATLDANGKTIAILPSALDKVLPPQNRGLAREIVNNGGLVISEYSVNSTMNKFNYAQRDRIQSLLTDVALVIQSDDDGGTMIAVRKSLKDGKRVYAIKGNRLTLIDNYIDVDSEEDLNKLL